LNLTDPVGYMVVGSDSSGHRSTWVSFGPQQLAQTGPGANVIDSISLRAKRLKTPKGRLSSLFWLGACAFSMFAMVRRVLHSATEKRFYHTNTESFSRRGKTLREPFLLRGTHGFPLPFQKQPKKKLPTVKTLVRVLGGSQFPGLANQQAGCPRVGEARGWQRTASDAGVIDLGKETGAFTA